MNSAEIRQAFLEYFEQNGHQRVDSSPLIPANDPTLLFTNAGMVQFKETFLGQEKRAYSRATSSQRCVRAGGKHNDLENVGYTARHHTFFEMLGNFSFGDYFKREAINFAWNFLTQELKLPAEKLWVTVYEEDREAEDIWLKELKVDPMRFSRCGEKDNFWAMGDTGPCGPCTEIFYDHGPDIAGGPPGSPEEDGDRYIEIWNLVFMQYNRSAEGRLAPLPKPSVDTGMGLERIAAVMQGVHNNYDIDLFQTLIQAIAKLASCHDQLDNPSLRVIADHIRACSFMLTDGVRPSNEGRGYVLRRIIRRAVRHGHKLGIRDVFFYKLVAPLVTEMGDAYPELAKAQAVVEQLLEQEETQFVKTLDQGLKVLEEAFNDLKDDIVDGSIVFKLYDTYGFPVDLTADVARERNLKIDEAGFEQAMAQQRKQSQAASQFAKDYNQRLKIDAPTKFTGYDTLSGKSTICALFKDNQPVVALNEGERGIVVLEESPFYAESGGQAGDQGVLSTDKNIFAVLDTTKQEDAHLHLGEVKQGKLTIGQIINTQVDQQKRDATRLNHSATHLLHAALRQVLGEHVVQKGSLVNAEKLRFDFSHFNAPTAEELAQIEAIVNTQVRLNTAINVDVMSMKQAQEKGAMALFGEKYGDVVRVLSMGDEKFSIELCGGTHANRTGDIGCFKITSEQAIASGVRRIEAVTGAGAVSWLAARDTMLRELALLLKTNAQDVPNKVNALLNQNRLLEKNLNAVKGQLASQAGSSLADAANDIGGVKVLIQELPGADPKALRSTVDQLKNKLGSAVICLAAVHNNKVNLVVGVTKDSSARIHAGELINIAAEQVGGKGGGRADMAQAGGPDVTGLQSALNTAQSWVEERLLVTS